MCPVKTFRTYLEKLNPKCKYLWQRPRDAACIQDDDTFWYTNQKMGEKTLGGMMSTMSIEYGLSQR